MILFLPIRFSVPWAEFIPDSLRRVPIPGRQFTRPAQA